MLKEAALLITAMFLAGCSSSGSPMPTGPSAVGVEPPVAVTQNLPVGLRGWVMDTAYRPLAGARIEVLDGASAGMTATSGDDGQFVLNGFFDPATRFRASMNGHETRIQPWNCSVAVCLGPNNAQPWLWFSLSVFEPTVNIAGDYTLTFTADSACTDLPDLARARSYRVTVTAQPLAGRPSVPGFDVRVTGVSLVGTLTGFPIGAAGNRLTFGLHGRHDPAIVEDLGANTYLAFSGGAEATVGPAGISTLTATFDGWIEHVALTTPLVQWYFPLPAATSKSTCDSSSNRLTLTRAN